MDMDAKARSKMTLSIMTEQDRKMNLGMTWEHTGWNNRALHKLHIKGKHLVRGSPEDLMSRCRRVAIIYTYLNLFEISKGPINVPSVIL